jgi:hypothetical protein
MGGRCFGTAVFWIRSDSGLGGGLGLLAGLGLSSFAGGVAAELLALNLTLGTGGLPAGGRSATLKGLAGSVVFWADAEGNEGGGLGRMGFRAAPGGGLGGALGWTLRGFMGGAVWGAGGLVTGGPGGLVGAFRKGCVCAASPGAAGAGGGGLAGFLLDDSRLTTLT